VVDGKASKAVLEILLQMVNVRVDMANLDKRAKDTEMLIQTIEQQMLAAKGGRQFEGQQPPQKPRDTGYIS
jgi:proteasome assembly chaperone (PAC2) family protein